MYTIRKLSVLIITIFIAVGTILPIISCDSAYSASVSGLSTFYFTNYLDIDGTTSYDSLGFFPSLSIEPSNSTKDNYYPPRISDLSENQDKLVLWLSYWTLSFLDEIIGEDISEYMDLFGDFDILLPHPLRIIESIENNEQDSLIINGNVEFRLEFSSDIISKMNANDHVKVSLYNFNLITPTLIDSKTMQITTSPLSKINSQTITLENLDAEIDPGESILCAIEIIPSNRTLTQIILRDTPIISSLSEEITDLILSIAENSANPEIQDILTIIDEIRNISSEYNFSKSDLSELINAVIGPSLIYDSINHEATITIPFSSSSENHNSVQYYLSNNNILTKDIPTGDFSTISVYDQSQIWDTPIFPRSKILTSAQTILYINHKDYRFLSEKMEVKVSLVNGNNEISSDNFTLEKTLSLTTTPKSFHISFPMDPQGTEIAYNDKLSMRIELSNVGGNIGQNVLQAVDLYYGGSEYRSSLTLILSETDHISVSSATDPSDGKIIVGETVVHTLSIFSRFQDDLGIQKKSSDHEQGYWDVTISPSSFSINANEERTVQVKCDSTKYSLDAYNQKPLSVEIEILGKTGYTTTILTAEVSEDAVTFSTLISPPKSKELKQGSNHTFFFSVKNNNTGLWPSSYIYTAVSEHNFSIDIDPLTFDNLGVQNISRVNVTIHIPRDIEIKYDILTFKAISKRDGTEYIEILNNTIVSASSEDIFAFFESLAKDLGLDDSFGEFAPFIIPILLIIFIFLLLIIIVFILTSHPLYLSCSETKKEIYQNESAYYTLILKNRLSKKQIVDVKVDFKGDKEKWVITSFNSPLVLLPKESKNLRIKVKPTEMIRQDNFSFIDVIISSSLQKKPIRMNLEIRIKSKDSDLTIKEVAHQPKSFRSNEKISTSFQVWNNGLTQTKQLHIKMFINGKEKNKVEDIIIPARRYAEIHMPWIAVKGKNNISLIIS
jgi:hypothetical protein